MAYENSIKIDKMLWEKCGICGETLKEMREACAKRDGVYSAETFKEHVETSHGIDMTEYFEQYAGISIPICACGVCNQKVRVVQHAAFFYYGKYRCGRNAGVVAWSEKAKIERKGEGNPRYGCKPWNFGLTVETSQIVRGAINKLIGGKATKEQRAKQRLARSLSPLKARHTTPHSEATKELIRQKTLEQIKRGCFTQLKSKPHIVMSQILESLGIIFKEEFIHGVFSFDFHIVDTNIFIEVDGDYFHSNPKFYPNGPVTKTQKINWCRDMKKNNYANANGLKVYHYWEDDIINHYEVVKASIKETLDGSTKDN